MSKKITTKIIVFLTLATLLTGGLAIYRHRVIKNSFTKNDGDYVILLHGLGRTSLSMQKLGATLAHQNYRVINLNYPSRQMAIKELTNEHLAKKLNELSTDTKRKVHFITHSMGGILTRYYLSHHSLENIGKVVMLAPPNQGSYSADQWSSHKIANEIMGPALQELSTHKSSLVNQLPEANYELGIIAGKYDGKVSIDQSKLMGMKDFLIVNSAHTYIMNSKEVIQAIENFLKTGLFK